MGAQQLNLNPRRTRVDLDRRIAKRKVENLGLLVQVHPNQKEDKMLGKYGGLEHSLAELFQD